ncbi:quinohemoprotein amine dehydrogenase subunit beta [Thiolinea disciformis]|uniref:quinohemoprotein amine dehydrogenase subunit beta n=1 Tax=Thiolinea disciformis TaxID=125614 RepID=UPI0003604FE0|nr:quinohemoprotein amine dehydrogenase subunit beta [Thiolinea disciformis]
MSINYWMSRLGLGLLLLLGVQQSVLAKDFIVTMSKPNNLYLIDADTKAIVKECKLEGIMNPGILVMSPDNKIVYILSGYWENVYGVEVDTCNIVFSAIQSGDGVRAKTIGSLAVSKDGKELYTIQNRTKLHRDHFEVLEPQLTVYDTAAGLKAKPLRTFPAPRRITVMATGENGKVYASGHELFEVDPQTGKFSVKIANASWDRPTYSRPDVLAFWPIGSQNNEFMLLYTAMEFKDTSKKEVSKAVWGYETVNLKTGETAIDDFAPLEVIMFSGVRSPQHPDKLFGVYTQLSKHDLATDKLIKRVELPHTYYCINVSTDGKFIYVGGTADDIGIYDAESLERVGEIRLPSGGDMGVSTLHVFSRPS